MLIVLLAEQILLQTEHSYKANTIDDICFQRHYTFGVCGQHAANMLDSAHNDHVDDSRHVGRSSDRRLRVEKSVAKDMNATAHVLYRVGVANNPKTALARPTGPKTATQHNKPRSSQTLLTPFFSRPDCNFLLRGN